jgi:hypothetical protein
MVKMIVSICLGVLMSFYLFPVSFSILPVWCNSKMLLAFFGVVMFLLNAVRFRSISFSKELLYSMVLASIFSLLCFFSIILNNTNDYSYALYIVSFFTWLMGAYALCEIFRYYYGRVTLSIITKYMIYVCVVQCIISQFIQQSVALHNLIGVFFGFDTGYFEEIDRLYGIGAALDPAGCRSLLFWSFLFIQ